MNMDVGPLVLLAPQGVAEPEERMPAGYVPMGVPAGAQTVPRGSLTSTTFKYYTALKLKSKSHFYGRAAAEEIFSEVI